MPSVGEILKNTPLDRLDAELLLTFVLKKDRSFILAHPEYMLSTREVRHFILLESRRKVHEPLAYITGEKEFFGLPFFVNRSTLIPRPETELLVETALHEIQKVMQQKKKMAVVDIGTGSGAIIVSIAYSLKKESKKIFSFFATDISKQALVAAEKNAKRNTTQTITFLHGSLLAPLQKKLRAFDHVFLVANLPYLSSKLYQETEPTVQDYEPRKALLGGYDGLDHYRDLFRELEVIPRTGKVHFFLEISPEQKKSLPGILPPNEHLIIKNDLSSRPRLVSGILPKKQ